MRIFYDTEFLERGPAHPIDLISIGMVREDGAEYYAVSAEFDIPAVIDHPWLRANVWPYLPTVGKAALYLDLGHPDVKSRAQVAAEVAAFVLEHPDPQLWAWYGAYDHVALCQLFGRMINLPTGFPMWTNDLRQEAQRLGAKSRPDWPEQGVNLHKAIDDARWDRGLALYLDRVAAE